MVGAWLIIAHMLGDYVLQSHWMATRKRASSAVAVAHAVTYTAPFAVLSALGLLPLGLAGLAIIAGTHAVIDRFGLARWVVWAKNQLAPARFRHAQTATGYPDDVPPWLSVWLLIAADNALHLTINAAVVAGGL